MDLEDLKQEELGVQGGGGAPRAIQVRMTPPNAGANVIFAPDMDILQTVAGRILKTKDPRDLEVLPRWHKYPTHLPHPLGQQLKI